MKIFNADDFPSYLPKLNALYDDLFTGGKSFRSKLTRSVSEGLGLSEKQILLLCQTIEFIHNASLLHDDLIDRSVLRRSKPAAWTKYSPEYAVLAGDYLLARVMVNLSRYGNLRLIQYTSEMISDLLEGEWIQDSLVQDWNVSLNQLDEVHDLKTASLFKWCLRAPFLMAEENNEEIHQLLERMGALLGLLFQRGDDLLDFDVRNDEKKAILGDLKSGYLNSFASYLLKDFPTSKKEELKTCETLEGVFKVIGREYFGQSLKQFDQMNEEVMRLYHHYLENLRALLKSDQQKICDVLSPLDRILYFRRA